MRIVVHGQQAFGKAVLEALIKRGENVVAVYVAPEKPGAEARSAEGSRARREAAGLSAGVLPKPEVWEEFRALKPDLQVMAFVTLFVPEEFLNIPTHGSIQYHPSLLPAYRGASAINWPIIKGEKETGLSIFWPDNGLDTGDVLVQKKTPISATDTLGTVYFDRLFPMGVEAMMEVRRPRQSRQGAAHQAGRSEGDLRRPLRPRQCQDRLGQAVGADRPADPRLQSGARRLDDARRQDAARSSTRSRCPPRTRRASPASSARSSRSMPTASRSSAPMAASRSRACSRRWPEGRRRRMGSQPSSRPAHVLT